MYDEILQDCVFKDVKCSYLQSLFDLDALAELQCMYLHKVKACDCHAQKLSKQTKSVSKNVHTELLQRFAKLEQHSISLEIALQKCKEQVKNDTVCNEKASNVFRKEREQYFEIQDLKAQMQDKNIAISELKKFIEKGKGKSVDTKFDRPSVVRQPNAQRIPKPSVLGKLTHFLNSLDRIHFQKTRSVPKANVSEGLSKPVTTQTLPKTAKKAVSNINVLKPGRIHFQKTRSVPKANVSEGLSKPVTTQTLPKTAKKAVRVNHKPNVSRPQLKSDQSRDKVLPNNSQVKAKKTQVEVHHRIPSVSNKTKSVTACKDSLNSRTLNANVVCATCNKCLIDSNHFACVTKMLNDVHARTKKPNIVQLILFIVDSGCTKHMTGNLKLLCNFIEKFPGTVRFGNDQFAPILGYRDLVQGNVMINRDIVIGLPKLKYIKDQLCSFCELSKAKRSSFNSKVVPSSKGRLNLIHIDLCGPIRVASINGKKDILVIVDDYSRGTEFLNKTLNVFFKEEGIEHQTSTARTPKQNGVVKRRNRLVPQQKKASDYDNPDLVPQRQDVYSLANADVPSQRELEMLFGPLYDEFSMQKKENTYQMMNLPILSVHQYKKLLRLPHTTL
nr:hypothetical protein [Tanacetum cinerariifolium]